MKRTGALFLLVACSAPSIPIDELPQRASKTICARHYACCSASELMSNGVYGPDQAACETRLAAVFDLQRAAAKTAESKMRAVYRGDKLAECLSAYEQLTCEQLKRNQDSELPACEALFEPKVATGSACGNDLECLSGSCAGASSGADGTCAAKAGSGESCSDADCAKGTYCRGSDSTCQPLKADGEACAANGECATGGCNGRNPDGGMPNMGTCGEKGGPGTMCYATDGCSLAGGAPLILLAALALTRRRRR